MRQKYTGTWNPWVTEKHFSKIFYLFVYLFFIWLPLISLLTFLFQPLSFSCTDSSTLILHSSEISPRNDSFPSVCNLFIYFSIQPLPPSASLLLSSLLLAAKLSRAFHLWMRDTERGSICRRSRSVWVEPSTLGIRLLTINRHLVCFGPDVLLFTEIARSQRDSSPLHPNSAVILTKWGYATFDI